MEQSLGKSERLTHVKVIESIFDRKNEANSSFNAFPVLMIRQLAGSETSTTQVLFSVSKRRFKKAVERNLLKRRLRESYRLNKHLIRSNLAMNIVFLYTAKEILEFRKIEASMIRLLKSLEI